MSNTKKAVIRLLLSPLLKSRLKRELILALARKEICATEILSDSPPVLQACRDGTFRKRLEIQHTGIPPPLCFLLLNAQRHFHLTKLVGINVGFYLLPALLHIADAINTPVIVPDQLVP